MEEYKVQIFPTAQSDMREMVDYINTLSPEAALKHYDCIIQKIRSLGTTPERCPLCKDVQLRLRGYRTLPVKNYIVFFVVNKGVVEIRRILYFRRQYKKLL